MFTDLFSGLLSASFLIQPWLKLLGMVLPTVVWDPYINHQSRQFLTDKAVVEATLWMRFTHPMRLWVVSS